MVPANEGSGPSKVAEWSVLSTRQIAQKYSVGRQTVWEWITNGVQLGGARHRLPATKVGGQYRIEPSALDRFVDVLNQPTSGEAPAVSVAVSPPSERRLGSAQRRGRSALERALSKK